jgi:two-component system, OmpR family, sensor histidine kinase KdpD
MRPSAETLLRDLGAVPRLTVYIAVAPGAGKTHRLLQDARRLIGESMRVAIGNIETKGRPDLEELARGIPRIPARIVRIGNAEFSDFDYDAALAQKPQIIILDELAHTNAQGGRHIKRWQDACALRDAGISVIGALNIAHLDSVAPIAERLVGFPVREIVPMSFLRKADQVIALDTPPEELEARLLSGRILRTDDIEHARNGIFRPHTLRMLREMMLRTIDDITIPHLEAAKTSTALALLTAEADARTFIRDTAHIAQAFDLFLEIARFGKSGARDRSNEIAAIAAEYDLHVVDLPNFNPNKPCLDDVKAAFIAVSNGSLARRLAGVSCKRDLFIADPHTQQLSQERPLWSGMYDQAAGDRMRIGYGRLTIYLGAAAGCGKTYAMLDRAHRLRAEGIDVLAAFVETHRRTDTERMLSGLELLPRKTVIHEGIARSELDWQAVLAINPSIALIDELAHTNEPGSLRAKRYDDVLAVLRAGISVITTLNVQHLEGLNDAVARITGTHVRETVPDEILRLADEVIFIDATPEVLRERLRQGKMYSSERIETALAHFFRTENLNALRELAVREVIRARGETPVPFPMGRIMLGVGEHDSDIVLIERCARIAHRLETDLSVVHAARERDDFNARIRSSLQTVAERCRARWRVAYGDDAAATLLQAAASERVATIAVKGISKRPRLPFQATFAQRLLAAGAKQLLVLAAPST